MWTQTLWTVLVDASAKSAVLLLLAWLTIKLFMRHSSAARRHLVWTGVLCACLVMPALSISLPQWQILPNWNTEPAPAVLASAAVPAVATPLPAVAQESPAMVEQHVVPEVVTSPAPSRPSLWHEITWRQWLMMAWLAGAGGCLVPLAVGRFAVARICRSARPGSAEVLVRLADVAATPHSVPVLLSAKCRMPMACGILQRRVVLPDEAEHWPEQRVQAVLDHELAHVRRRDCLWQTLGQMARALYCFNPLAWMAYRQLLCDAEKACDDAVITQGSRASSYAEHLMAIATAGRSDAILAAAAIAMARPNTLEGRLMAILDAARNRKRVTVVSVVAACMLLGGIAIPLAMLRAVGDSPIPEATRPAQPQPFVAQLPGGISVELLGICEHPSEGKQWWQPNGSPLPDAPYDDRRDGPINISRDQIGREFAVRVSNPKSIEFKAAITDAGATMHNSDPKKAGKRAEGIQYLAGSFRTEMKAATLRFGAPTEEWKTVGTTTGRGFSPETSGPVVFTPMTENDGGVQISINHDITDRETRLLAVTTDGRSSTASVWYGPAAGSAKLYTFTFRNVKAQQIREFQFQACRFKWTEFKDVPLYQGQPTRPKEKAAIATADDKTPATSSTRQSADMPSGRLDFRIVIGRGQGDPSVSDDEARGMIAQLAEHGPDVGHDLGIGRHWFPLDANVAKRPEQLPVTAQWHGRWYVLASADPKHTMLADEGVKRAWGLVRTHVAKDAMDKPAVGFDFDQAGAARFRDLTTAHIGGRLAVLVDGQVVNVATINSVISNSGIITSSEMTERDVVDLVTRLQRGMPAVTGPASKPTGWEGFDPEVEVVVPAVLGDLKTAQLRLADGKLVSPPPEEAKQPFGAEWDDWVRQSGVDLMAANNAGFQGLMGFDMAAAPLGHELSAKIAWASVLRDLRGKLKPGSPALMSAAGTLPTHYVIQTRNGNLGILTILELTNSPKGVRIRYRLLHGGNATEREKAAP